jgi:Flp pilus assembly protein TadD
MQTEEADVGAEIETYATSLVQAAATDGEKAKIYQMIGNLAASFELYELSEKWFRRLSEQSARGRLLLAASLAAQGDMSEATKLCLDTASYESVEATIVLAQLFTSMEHTDEEFDAAKPIIEATFEDNQQNVALLMALGVMYSQKGADRTAVEMFRRILVIAPDNVLALNNLATMLAEQPQGRAEALKHIGRAIAIAGRTTALLDTQGTIYLLAGDYEKAIESLEEAAAGFVGDPRVTLHLAAAYDASGRTEDAKAMAETAIGRGVVKAMLTSQERASLRHLQERYASSNAL